MYQEVCFEGVGRLASSPECTWKLANLGKACPPRVLLMSFSCLVAKIQKMDESNILLGTYIVWSSP